MCIRLCEPHWLAVRLLQRELGGQPASDWPPWTFGPPLPACGLCLPGCSYYGGVFSPDGTDIMAHGFTGAAAAPPPRVAPWLGLGVVWARRVHSHSLWPFATDVAIIRMSHACVYPCARRACSHMHLCSAGATRRLPTGSVGG